MNINISMFNLKDVRKSNGHEDFYFSVTDKSLLDELISKYNEMCLEYISFIYSKDEDSLYITKGFIFNSVTAPCSTEPEIYAVIKDFVNRNYG